MTYHEIVQSYQIDMAEFKNEAHCKCVRLRALYDKLTELEDELFIRYRDYDLSSKNGRPYFDRALIAYPIDSLLKEIKNTKMSIRVLNSGVIKTNTISPDMIVNARNCPISEVLDVNKAGFALCPQHIDKKPSLYTKGNYGYCFSCGYSGDVIDIYQKKYGVRFIDAVKKLQTIGG